MDVTKFYGRKKISKSVRIKEIAYNDSEDSELASDSDTEKRIFSISSAKNKIIPETDSESDDEAVHNGTHQETREEATSRSDMEEEEGNENGSQVRAIGMGQRNKKTLVWNNVPKQMTRPILPWKRGSAENLHFPDPAISYIKRLVDNSMISDIVNQTNLYSTQKDPHKLIDVTKSEIEQFIGTLFFMSIYGLPRTEMYWGTETRISQVADVMSRNRWQGIKTNRHLNDNSNSDQTTDKLFKLRPFLDSLSNNLQKIPIDEKVCVHEQIIPFKVTHSLKVYVKNKPKKWGYKVFALCDCSGVLLNFEIYTGKEEYDSELPDVGVSGNVVLRLTKVLQRHMNHKVYYDNWFSSVNVLVELEKMGIQSLGTVRPNRLPGCSFINDKEMKRQGRGTVEEKVSSVEGVEIIALKWYDNKPVHLVSSFAGAYPTSTVQRWDRKEKKSIQVQCPSAIMIYNKFMGGLT